MIRPLLLLTAVALLAQAQAPRGPSPTEQYHVGAQAYIDGDNARALRAVEAGLAVAPDDAKLQALRDLLEQQQQEQDQQDGGQQDDAQNQDPGDQGDEGDQGEDGDQQEQDRPDDGGPEAEQDQTRTQQPDEAGAGDAPPQPAAREPDEMSAAQAERILDAVGGEERLLLRELRRAPTQRRRSDKDW